MNHRNGLPVKSTDSNYLIDSRRWDIRNNPRNIYPAEKLERMPRKPGPSNKDLISEGCKESAKSKLAGWTDEKEYRFQEGLKYTDTAKARCRVNLTRKDFMRCGWVGATIEDYEKGHTHYGYHKNVKTATNALVKARYIPKDYTRQPNFSLELSVPKVSHGHNRDTEQVEINMEMINDAIKLICEPLGVEFPDIRAWTLMEQDISVNYATGADTADYLNYVSKRKVSRKQRGSYNNDAKSIRNTPLEDKTNNGTEFFNEKSKLKVYDKGIEAGAKNGPGILRLEASALCKWQVQQWYRKKEVTFGDINRETAQRVITKSLHDLGLDVPIKVAGNVTEEMVSLFGRQAYLYKQLVLEMENNPQLTKVDLAKKVQRNLTWITNAFKMMKDAGISFSNVIKHELPALGFPKQVSDGKRLKVLSDTTGSEKLADDHSDTNDQPQFNPQDEKSLTANPGWDDKEEPFRNGMKSPRLFPDPNEYDEVVVPGFEERSEENSGFKTHSSFGYNQPEQTIYPEVENG